MKSIFVGNLTFGATEDEIRTLFQNYGNVSRVSIMMDRETGRSRGFAFVEMANDEEAESAISGTNGSSLGGRTLNVNEARPRPDRGAGGGGGGYGGARPSGGGGGGGGNSGGGGGGGRGNNRDDYRGHVRQPREPRW